MLGKVFLLRASARAPHPRLSTCLPQSPTSPPWVPACAQTPKRSRLPLGILALQQSAFSCLHRRSPCAARLKLLQELHRLRLVEDVVFRRLDNPAWKFVAQGLQLCLDPNGDDKCRTSGSNGFSLLLQIFLFVLQASPLARVRPCDDGFHERHDLGICVANSGSPVETSPGIQGALSFEGGSLHSWMKQRLWGNHPSADQPRGPCCAQASLCRV